ncbi:hypothetical protein THAOC_00256 [Thalassiosira oceanica]|uniref:Uncharacterized protein n=1 Tax=Thalassiosira oceanica TaxID=159749 RepID=K0TJN0_THAOC|nr:hypothetical protein THAOC_00256 [Thalassiosira oceanica]|eukprot:EJK77880.1 hypothetical protein THAOC_00256 [Thalassiosira oceanica]
MAARPCPLPWQFPPLPYGNFLKEIMTEVSSGSSGRQSSKGMHGAANDGEVLHSTLAQDELSGAASSIIINIMQRQIPEDVESMSDNKSGFETGTGCAEGRDDVTIESTQKDTLGLRYADVPKRGGVVQDTDFSVAEISEITDPTAMVPCMQIDVPRPMDITLSTVIDIEVGSLPNSAEVLTDAKRKAYARTNLQAGIQALEKEEYDRAAAHFATGRKHLGENGWKVDKAIMLELCSEGAKAYYKTGDIDVMNELIGDILRRDIPLKEKFIAYEYKMLAEQAEGNYNESISLGLDVLRQLGLSAPKNKKFSTLEVLVGYLRTNRALGKRTAEELLCLPKMTDEAQPTMFVMLVFMMVRETLNNGISASSIDAFVSYGVILCGVFRETRRGRELAKAGELLLASSVLPERQSRVAFASQGLVYHWSMPLRDTLAPLLEGHRVGIEYADIESTGLNLSFYVDHTFYSGCCLEGEEVSRMIQLHIGLQNDARTVTTSKSQTNYISSELLVQNYLLAVKKLRGIETLKAYVYTLLLELSVFFGEWEEGMAILQKTDDVRTALLGSFGEVRFTISEALISIKAAQISSSTMSSFKWSRRAWKSLNLVRGWSKKGNVNVHHSMYLLNAEFAALRGKKRMAGNCFTSAIGIARNRAFLQDLALSHELASGFYQKIGDDSNKEFHLQQAVKCYSEWGATSKVDQLVNLKTAA